MRGVGAVDESSARDETWDLGWRVADGTWGAVGVGDGCGLGLGVQERSEVHLVWGGGGCGVWGVRRSWKRAGDVAQEWERPWPGCIFTGVRRQGRRRDVREAEVGHASCLKLLKIFARTLYLFTVVTGRVGDAQISRTGDVADLW